VIKRRYALAFVALIVCASDAARGDESTRRRLEVVESLPVELSAIDLAVPASPAFTALGFTPDSVTRPASPRQFATDILSGLDPNGNFQAGLALDTVPWLLIRGNELTIRDYESSLAQRLASNFQFSAATTKGTDSDDESVRLALGFKLTPYDEGDPRLDQDLRKCLKAIVIPDPTDFDTLPEYNAALDVAEAAAEADVEACHEEAKQRLWNASAWELGGAPTWIQEQGTDSKTKWNGGTFWTSFAYGFKGISALEKTSQLIVALRYRLDEETPDPDQDDVFFQQDTLLAGARLRIGRPNLAFSLEGSYLHEDPENSQSESAFRGAVTSDIRLPGPFQLWLNVGVGGTVGEGENDRVFLTSALSWGGQSVNLAQVLNALGH
jgi:hypothetical protein